VSVCTRRSEVPQQHQLLQSASSWLLLGQRLVSIHILDSTGRGTSVRYAPDGISRPLGPAADDADKVRVMMTSVAPSYSLHTGY
jgi:hypothetical protein